MKIIPLTKSTVLNESVLGGKASNLQRLITWDLQVPKAYVIPANEARLLAQISDDAISKNIVTNIKQSTTMYAVRSSGVGEDGKDNSFAGIFDTVLDVAYADLPGAIRKVYRSKNTTVTSMYASAKDANVMDMAILIQEMVDADYAGVAFSVNPIEQDTRIGLIELVKGVGESLVSGKIKPTSVRINKLTGMKRVLQQGADRIDEHDLTRMIEQVSVQLLKIEKLYGTPIDIEWGIKDRVLYLLQARPITTIGEVE